jgi:hypothetical protein
MSGQAVRRLEDLQPIHGPGMNPITEAKLRSISDEELLQTALNPRNGQLIKVSPGANRLLDGNTRVREMQRRMADPNCKFKPDTLIPVEEITT